MAQGDFTLLQLTSFPNVDVQVLGWSSDEIASNEQVTGISHPRGDYKRIAFGQRTRDVTIRFDGGERMPASVGYQVAWFQGLTQSGSSGSPLLVNLAGKQYLVGTLTAGPDVNESNSVQVCRTDNLVASYGRFAVAYPYLQSFLTSSTGAGNPVTAGPAQGSITASPNPITLQAGQSTGRTTLTWQTSGVAQVQIRVGSPTGPAMTGIEGPTGSASTGDWVGNGTIFYLQNASDGDSSGAAKTLARVIVQTTGGNSNDRSGTITANPSTIVVSPGQTTGRTNLSWRATGVTRVQVRIDSPSGPAMTAPSSPIGSASTGSWVRNGMTFYLQDASDGNSSGSAKTIASVRVSVASR
jgi:hypothetical protein